MANQKILIVDDDVNICQLLNLYLVKDGFSTSICHNGKEAIKLVQNEDFDIVLLDIMMPEMDGFETLAHIRKISNLPVIMVSAKGEPMDKITGLDLGADDYVTKPFEPQELISRIKALLRRSQPPVPSGAAGEITIGALNISLTTYIVKVGDRKLDMPPKEIELIYFLATNPNRVYSREQLLTQVWGPNYKGDTRTVDVHVKRIREKLGVSDKWSLETVWRVGYKFDIYKD